MIRFCNTVTFNYSSSNETIGIVVYVKICRNLNVTSANTDGYILWALDQLAEMGANC